MHSYLMAAAGARNHVDQHELAHPSYWFDVADSLAWLTAMRRAHDPLRSASQRQPRRVIDDDHPSRILAMVCDWPSQFNRFIQPAVDQRFIAPVDASCA